MARIKKKLGRRERLKPKKESTRSKPKPYGVCYCHKENKAIGYVPVSLKANKSGKIHCKDKAYAEIWKSGATWVSGYEPDELAKLKMIDHEKAFCPKCGSKASFIILYDVKITDKALVSPKRAKEMADQAALNEFDEKYANSFHNMIKDRVKKIDYNIWQDIHAWIDDKKPIDSIRNKYIERAKIFVKQEIEILKRIRSHEKNR